MKKFSHLVISSASFVGSDGQNFTRKKNIYGWRVSEKKVRDGHKRTYI